MLKKSTSKSALMVALVTGNVIWGGTVVHAEEPNQAFTLDPMVVTAQRMETRDLDTPASTTIISDKEIKDAGYKNVFDAIDNQLGLSSTGYGDAGQEFGFSSGRTVIRGFDRGTLVMVDGIPMNLKNYNSADSIPISMVERIEIVKGAAGTLYGAEAMGGVVNIITKRPSGKERVTTRSTIGNYYKDYNVTLASEDFMISAGKEYSNKRSHSNDYPNGSETDWWVGKGQTDRAAITARLSEEVSANFFYQNGKITCGGHKYASTPVDYNYRYEDTRMTTGLNYTGKNNGIKAMIGYNYRKANGFDYIKNKAVDSNARLDSYVFDFQKQWNIKNDSFILGYTLRRENYEGLVKKTNVAHRTDNAIYLSYDKQFSDKFKTTLGLRGEKFSDLATDKDILLPQIQTLYKFDEDTSWYINIGKAFQMPAVDSYFTSSNYTNLVPEQGWNYETGVKKLDGNKIYKLSIYHMKFKDKFGWSGSKNLGSDGKQYIVNKGDFRNTGIEFEVTNKVDDNWQYRLGAGYGNPEIYDKSAKKPEWIQDSGRLDLIAGITYNNKKIMSDLTFKYLGDREDYNDRQIPVRARLTLNTMYSFTSNDNVTLTINNLLDRDNYSNRYGNLDLPLNWKVMYEHTF